MRLGRVALLVMMAAGALAILPRDVEGQFRSDRFLQYLQTPADTGAARDVTLGASEKDVIRLVRLWTGADNPDTAGVGTYFAIWSDAAVVCSVYANGAARPVFGLMIPAAGSEGEEYRFIDSVITVAGAGGATIKARLFGHKEWWRL